MGINGSKFPLGRPPYLTQTLANGKEQGQKTELSVSPGPSAPLQDSASLNARKLEEEHFSHLHGLGLEERLGKPMSNLDARIRSVLKEGRDLSNEQLGERLSVLYRSEFSQKLRVGEFCSALCRNYDPEQTSLTRSQFETLSGAIRVHIAVERLHEQFPHLRS